MPDDEQLEAEIVPDATPSQQPPPAIDPGYTDDGVPTFGYVEHRVQSMRAKGEMDAQTPAAKNADWDDDQRKRAGKAKLEEIRRSMRGE